MVDDTEKVPALSCTTWPAGQALIAAWMSAPGESVAQTVVRCGMPSAPRGTPSWPSARMPGFHAVFRALGMSSEPPTVTVALSLLEGSATLVATTWYVPAEPGALYWPEPSIDPPAAPSWTDQVTAGDRS